MLLISPFSSSFQSSLVPWCLCNEAFLSLKLWLLNVSTSEQKQSIQIKGFVVTS